MWFWLAIVVWVVAIATFAFNRTLVPSTGKRFLIYLAVIPVVAIIAGSFIVSSEDCPPDASDCDLAGLAGFFVAAIVVITGFGAAIVFEGIRAFNRAADRYVQR